MSASTCSPELPKVSQAATEDSPWSPSPTFGWMLCVRAAACTVVRAVPVGAEAETHSLPNGQHVIVARLGVLSEHPAHRVLPPLELSLHRDDSVEVTWPRLPGCEKSIPILGEHPSWAREGSVC